MFSIRVVNDEQEGVNGMRVTLGFSGLTRGMSTEVYTDSDGLAEFSGYDEGDVEVYVDGSSYGTYQYDDGASITITM